MKKLKAFRPPDSHHLEAAQGWLELGNHLEANEELDQITPELRAHPDVLELRWQIYARAQKWDACVDLANAIIKLMPNRAVGWIHRSFALHALGRTQDAFDNVLPVAEKFSKEWRVPYNLGCYCAQITRLEESEAWIKKAIEIDTRAVQQASIDDPDLKPLWIYLCGTMWKRE